MIKIGANLPVEPLPKSMDECRIRDGPKFIVFLRPLVLILQ